MQKNNKTLQMQLVFIQRLREVLPPNLVLAEEMVDVLGISTDSAYRRIRGETEISIDEVYKLASRYKLSVDKVFSNENDTVTFTYTNLTDSSDHLKKYLERLFSHVQLVGDFPDKKIHYIAGTFPLFYSFFSKKLCEFKLFFWQRSVLNVPEYQKKKFQFGLIPEELVSIAMDASKRYNSVPSTEVWTTETVNTNLKQIEFYYESGAFENKKDALEVLDDVKAMIESLESWAARGSKDWNSTEENFQFYCSEVELGTNCIHIQSGASKYAYISFNTLNSLNTNNQLFCNEIEHWIRNIIQKSTLISGGAEKQRFRFFNKIYLNIQNSRHKIEQA